jgi:hypothetical protein
MRAIGQIRPAQILFQFSGMRRPEVFLEGLLSARNFAIGGIGAAISEGKHYLT